MPRPRRAGSAAPGIRTFFVADVRGYTYFTQEDGDEAATNLAGKFTSVVGSSVEHRGGTLLELRGDEALAVFDSARQAVNAAFELQERFLDETSRALPLAVGIGLDAGEAVPLERGFRVRVHEFGDPFDAVREGAPIDLLDAAD
jgi:class 3 adenylate cyclase